MADFFGKLRQVNGTFAPSARAEAPKKRFLSNDVRGKRKLIALEVEIAFTYQLIDQIVHRVYAPTNAEIEIVEGAG